MFQPWVHLNLQRFSVCACIYVCVCVCVYVRTCVHVFVHMCVHVRTHVCVCVRARAGMCAGMLGDHSAHLTAISGASEYHGGCYLTLHPCLISSPALGTSFLANMFKIPFLDWKETHQHCMGPQHWFLDGSNFAPRGQTEVSVWSPWLLQTDRGANNSLG